MKLEKLPIASFCFVDICTDAFELRYLKLSFMTVSPVVAAKFHARLVSVRSSWFVHWVVRSWSSERSLTPICAIGTAIELIGTGVVVNVLQSMDSESLL